MGDEVLKSHHVLLTIVFYTHALWSAQTTLSLGNEVKVYDQIFEKISENRVLFKRTLSFKVEGHLRAMSYFLVKNMKKTSVTALDNLKKKLSDA